MRRPIWAQGVIGVFLIMAGCALLLLGRVIDAIAPRPPGLNPVPAASTLGLSTAPDVILHDLYLDANVSATSQSAPIALQPGFSDAGVTPILEYPTIQLGSPGALIFMGHAGEALRFESDGRVFVRGRLAGKDAEIYAEVLRFYREECK